MTSFNFSIVLDLLLYIAQVSGCFALSCPIQSAITCNGNLENWGTIVVPGIVTYNFCYWLLARSVVMMASSDCKYVVGAL